MEIDISYGLILAGQLRHMLGEQAEKLTYKPDGTKSDITSIREVLGYMALPNGKMVEIKIETETDKGKFLLSASDREHYIMKFNMPFIDLTKEV